MSTNPFPFANKMILLVEDNIENQELMKDMIEYLECKINIACNGEEALELWKKNPYDLVILDIQMPKMDGYQTAVEIRKIENGTRHTPILALTASAITIDREKCFASGMDDYLSKPINIDMLEKKLSDIFSKFPKKTE